MGIEHLQEFIEKECSKACQPVDLLKISREFTQQQYQKRGAPVPRGRNLGPSRLHLVVDAESCLDRLYGGYYSDWACGGQWNRMVHFLNNMLQACHSANMELVVYFNGALEGDRLQQWYAEQIEVKKKVAQVIIQQRCVGRILIKNGSSIHANTLTIMVMPLPTKLIFIDAGSETHK